MAKIEDHRCTYQCTRLPCAFRQRQELLTLLEPVRNSLREKLGNPQLDYDDVVIYLTTKLQGKTNGAK